MLLCSFCQAVHERASFLSIVVSSSMIIIISAVCLARCPAFVSGRNTTIMCSISKKRKTQSDNASSILPAKANPVFCHRSPSCTSAQGVTCFITVPSSTWHLTKHCFSPLWIYASSVCASLAQLGMSISTPRPACITNDHIYNLCLSRGQSLLRGSVNSRGWGLPVGISKLLF